MAEVKCHRKSQVQVDRIGLLPTDVLGLILSSLTLKEAVATSILSRRWRYLWTLIPKLDLDRKVLSHKRKISKLGEKEERERGRSDYVRRVANVLYPHQNPYPGSKEEREILRYARWVANVLSPRQNPERERSHYVKWVDSVISLHRRSPHTCNLEEFRLFSDLNMDHRRNIDKWLSYALSKGVQRLELNFNIRSNAASPKYDRSYTFPYKMGNFPENFKSLRSLFMHLVNVTGEALEFLVANCPHLERLSVIESIVLSSLEIIRPFPSFNYLEISLCHELKSVVVRDSNLVTINYNGNRIKFQLINVPLLTQVWIGGSLTERLDDAAKMFSSVLPQLETFKICFTHRTLYRKGTRRFASAVEMNNLKQLVVRLSPNYARANTFLPVIYLINASPRLERFVLEAPHGDGEDEDQFDSTRLATWARKRARKMMPRAFLHHLKEIEFVGYHGELCLFELMELFVEKDSALENITVDPRRFKDGPCRPWVCFPREDEIEIAAARASAKKKLHRCVPSRINVKIL